MNNSGKRLLLFFLLIAAATAFVAFDVGQYLTLEFAQSQRERFQGWFQDHPLQTALAYFAIYVIVTALSVPGATVMTLVGGAVFGWFWGVVIISFASTIGATLAFLVSRFLLRDLVQQRFGQRLETVNRGIERDGAYYLFTLRLVPVFPFFLINLLMGLTPMRSWTYYWVSQLGMFPATVVYVNAGTRLAEVEALGGLLAPELLASFALLGLFPFIARAVVEAVSRRRMLSRWRRPARFDRNLIVVGAGAAGLVSTYMATALRAKVTLIERDRMGGDCLNTGCVPSKALIRSTRLIAQMQRAGEFGLRSVQPDFDFSEVMQRVQRVISTVEPHDSEHRYTELGAEVIHGEARVISPWEVEVDGRKLSARNLIIATGGRPSVPRIPGLDAGECLTSDTVWSLAGQPQRLLVLGAGPIGCELAQCFARLGSRVTLLDPVDRLLPREDPEVSRILASAFTKGGIDLRLGYRAIEVTRPGDGGVLRARGPEGECELPFDAILAATGRVGNGAGLGLEDLGVQIRENGTIECDEFQRTRVPTIYACGDVAGPYQFTHVASHQAWYASVNALFSPWRRFRADYSVIPWCTFTDPEVARVGISEQEARARHIEYELTTWSMAELDRAIADEAREGCVRVLTVPGKDRILGATIVGEHAGEMIAEFVTAMRHGLGLNKVLGTLHVYPTWMEANRFAAGQWRRSRAPQRVLEWVQRYHHWRRG